MFDSARSTVARLQIPAPLVLASGSPRRAAILEDAGIPVDVKRQDISERRLPSDSTPEEWAVRLAAAKAARGAATAPGRFILGADTLVIFRDEVLGKPDGPADAAAMLRRLRGEDHRVVTAVALDGPGDGHWSGYSTSAVRMRAYTDGEIDAYVASGAPLDKAGGYGIQDNSFHPVAHVRGCYLNVVGLPLCLTGELMSLAGVLDGPGRDGHPACPACIGPDNTVVVAP